MAYIFTETKTQKDRELYSLEKTFLTQYRTSNEGMDISINDSVTTYKAIVKDHTNPLNVGIKDDDKRIMVLYKDLKCGDVVTLPNYDRKFLTVTNPSFNGVYSECKIRKIKHDIKFTIDNTQYIIPCDIGDGLNYEEGSKKNESNVFAEDESTAIILQSNEITSRLSLFDKAEIDGKHYKVANIDKTLTGCIQIVLYECFEDEIFKIDGTNVEIKGLGRYSRIKDYQTNSVATKLSVPFKTIKQGDIVYHTYKYPDGMIEEKRYITVSNENQNVNCDEFLLYECLNKINLVDENGNISTQYFFYENNRYRGRENSNDNISNERSEYEIVMQYNKFTKRLNKDVDRILIHIEGEDIEAYTFYGVEKLQKGLLRASLNSHKIDPNKDLIDHENRVYIANYYSDNVNQTPEDMIVGDVEIIYGDTNIYISKSSCVWKVDSQIATLEIVSDTECRVTAKDNPSHIGQTITISATVDNNVYEKEIRVVGW